MSIMKLTASKRLGILLITLSLLFASPIQAETTSTNWKSFKYTVIRVVDGDTVEATDGNIKFKVRIAGMDAPEHDQDFGKVAKSAISDLILNKQITLQPIAGGLDRYGRTLGQVFVNGNDVSLTMIQKGMATYYRPTCEDFPAASTKYNYDPRSYVEAEGQAKKSKLYIWSVKDFELPCAHRHRTKH